MVCLQRAGQLPQRRPDRGLLVGERLEHRVGGVDERGQVLVLVAELLGRAGGSCGSSGRCCRGAAARPPLMRAMSRAKRLELAQRVARACGRGSARVEGLGAAREQQLQEGLRVGVERGEELVGVDVRLGRGERERRRPPRRSRPAVPGSTSITMSLRPVFGRSSSEASSLDQARRTRCRPPSSPRRGRPRARPR